MGRKKKAFSAHFKPSKSNVGFRYGGSEGDEKKWQDAMAMNQKREIENDSSISEFLKSQMLLIESGLSKINDVMFIPTYMASDSAKEAVNHLKLLFRNQAPAEWEKKENLYRIGLSLSTLIIRDIQLATLLGNDNDDDSLVSLLQQCSEQALLIGHRSSHQLDEDAIDDIPFVTWIQDVAEAAIKSVNQAKSLGLTTSNKSSSNSSSSSSSTKNGKMDILDYKKSVGPLRFGFCEGFSNHIVSSLPKTNDKILNPRKIFKELASYSSVLPVELASSIFVRVNEHSLDTIRACIIGPEGTPYEAGCFFFDIKLKASYPQEAPLVKLRTTGGNTVRFNPNLYADGKVCLSLLGTWRGPGWMAGISTLLQVLLSIQGLIFVPDPYFNEPGYESQRGTSSGDQQSRQYNNKIRPHTIKWAILDHLQKLNTTQDFHYEEFRDVLTKHFLARRSALKEQMVACGKEKVKEIVTLSQQVIDQLDIFVRREAAKDPIVLDDHIAGDEDADADADDTNRKLDSIGVFRSSKKKKTLHIVDNIVDLCGNDEDGSVVSNSKGMPGRKAVEAVEVIDLI
jgi:ubiquitin-protein ligase